MSDDKPVVTQQENGKAPKAGARRHCAKFWWAYLIAFIIIVLLVVLLVIFVGVPKIAQKKLDQAKLNLKSIVVTHTQSDNYTMAIDTTIEADDSVHANIDGFKGQMYLEDYHPHTPFAEIDFPPTTSASEQNVSVNQFVPITDLKAFTTFNTWLLINDTLRVTVDGKTKIKVKGISKKFDVNFKKTITMPGLRSFNGTTVSQTSISLMPDDNGENFFGYTSIPNYSLVTFEIGNATFESSLLGKDVGTVHVDNIVLKPGHGNNFTMHSSIQQAPVLDALGKKPYCQSGVLPFELRGKNVINNGQHLSYYADALAASSQIVPINLAQPLDKVDIDIPCKK